MKLSDFVEKLEEGNNFKKSGGNGNGTEAYYFDSQDEKVPGNDFLRYNLGIVDEEIQIQLRYAKSGKLYKDSTNKPDSKKFYETLSYVKRLCNVYGWHFKDVNKIVDDESSKKREAFQIIVWSKSLSEINPDKKDIATDAAEALNEWHKDNIDKFLKITEWIKEGTIMSEALKADIKALLEANKNIILHGAPGTGKTYLAKEIANEMGCSENEIGFVQFHQSYDYTDFVEGLRPAKGENDKADGFERKDGVFKQFCEKALEPNASKKFVFIIDEINRGEMSKIFGELFFSIDPGYRGPNGKIRTQYANMQAKPNKFDEYLKVSDPSNCGHFFVPENVYIIGTMNDIDRRVESMDFAMRRRFAFQEVSAEDSMGMLDSKEFTDKVPDNTTRDHVKAHMKQLNDKIIEEKFKLNSSYQIGGAYFLKFAEYYNEKKNEEEAFKKLWKNHLEGTLKEYLRGMPKSEELFEDLKAAYKKEQKA